MDWIFPLFAATIYFATPSGCDKRINWILTGLFVLIWSFEELIVRVNAEHVIPILTDGLWYDGILFVLFSVVTWLFYLSGGKIQSTLSLFGVILCVLYAYWGNSGLYSEVSFRSDYYYIEVMISLYIAQLFVASSGMILAISSKALGGSHGIIASDSGHAVRRNNADNGNT